MANTKISELTAGTEPLTGTELVPIVQNGSTKMVDVDAINEGSNNFSTHDLEFYNERTHSLNGNDLHFKQDIVLNTQSFLSILHYSLSMGFGANVFKMDSNETVINDGATASGSAADFRVEAVSNPYAFRVDGVTGFIGNHNAPDCDVHIKGSGERCIKAESTGASNTDLTVKNTVGEWAFRVNTTGKLVIINSLSGLLPIKIDTLAYSNSLVIGSGEIVINDGGNDVDFRVESSTNQNALKVDGTTGNTEIGEDLDVIKNGGAIKMKSPNGTQFTITISDQGALIVV